MAYLPCLLSCMLALYATQGADDNTFVGGISESDTEEWYEIHYSGLLEEVYQSIFPTNTTTIHDQIMDLKDNFDIMKKYNLSNSLAGGKLSFLAEELIKNEDIKDDAVALEILNEIINESSIFAKNLATGFACHGVEPIRYTESNEELTSGKDEEYIVFYNPDQPKQITKGKVVANPNGNKIMIEIEQRRRKIDFKHSILIDRADYDENLRMVGNVVSRKVISVEEATDEEICALGAKPVTKICIPMSKIYTCAIEDAAKDVDTGYQVVEKHINICK